MFRLSEALNGKTDLTVKDGKAVIHVSLSGKGIVNLYTGTAEKAKADASNWLFPAVETLTYADGTTDSVNAYDIPLSVLDKEFDVAILGKKGVWYDHKVTVSLVE